MMWRLAAVVVYVFLGLGVGFVLWGNRVSNLTAALNRMMLEDDTLRGRLAHRQSTTGGDGTAVLSTLSLLSAEVSMQADLIDEQSKILEKQSRILDKLANSREQELKASLTKCSSAEGHLQSQIESCLFAKASLERQISELHQAAAGAPRRGSAPFETRVRSAQEVMEEVRGRR